MQLKSGLLILSVGVLGIAGTVRAGDFRIGLSLGAGATGISGTQRIQSVSRQVQRSEGPGMFSIFADYLISDQFSLGLSHSRGFRLGPMSSGVGFTGLLSRWYWFGPIPIGPQNSSESSTWWIKRFAPFLGFGVGVASGNINRSDDLVPDVNSSGLYLGYHLGVDYPFPSGMGLRPEIFYSRTLSSPEPLTEMGVQCGVYFPF